MSDLPSVLAENVKALRERKGWTQRELATRSRVARATVNRVEAGSRSPPLSTVTSIAKALGVTAERLLRPARSAA